MKKMNKIQLDPIKKLNKVIHTTQESMMKFQKLTYLLWIIYLGSTTFIIKAQTIHLGQFNIRYDNPSDRKTGNGWDVRSQKIVSLVRYEDWDLMGLQEVLHHQLIDLSKQLDEYAYVGIARGDGKSKGEYAPIFFKKERLNVIDNGTFWLSEQPNKAGSKGWDAALPRICTWAHFEHLISGQHFWLFNLHLDHVGKQSREEATRLVIQQIQEKCGPDPYLLTGDFNFNQQDANYTYITDTGLLVDAYESARMRWAENGSFNGFNVHHKTDNRIDFVFHSPHFVVDKYGVLTYIYWTEKPTEEKENEKEREQKLFIPRVMSDHFPISVKLEFPK